MRVPAVSFRARIVTLVLTVSIIPLFVLGLWITRATARAGEELLRLRLERTLDETTSQVAQSWTAQRSSLLDLAEAAQIRRRAAGRNGASRSAVDEGDQFTGVFDTTVDAPVATMGVVPFRAVQLFDMAGAVRWASSGPPPNEVAELTMIVDVHEGPFGPPIGALHGRLNAAALFGSPGSRATGIVIAATDVRSGMSLLPLPFDPVLLLQDRFSLGGERWLASRRLLSDPHLIITAAAPLSPYTQPLERVARTGVLLLLLVAVGGTVAALLLTTYLTHSLRTLARAADAVAAGELEPALPGAGRDEVGRVSAAFSSMTASLRRMMSELADRRALAAVGEFAASLAHEIRNPLTAVQLDLQMVEERLPAADTVARATQRRALEDIRRLDQTVAGALRAARSGRLSEETVALAGVVHAAARAAAPAIAASGAELALPSPDAPAAVRGDRAALEQVVLNLLLNAARAVRPGERIAVTIEQDAEQLTLVVFDAGIGIPAADLPRAFEPLFTTRKDGAGLGLAIARRLVEAHGGSITLESQPGQGTTARVVLPRDTT